MKSHPLPIRATIALVSVGLSLSAWSQTSQTGGPYVVLPGGSLNLDASASMAPDGATITAYEWDLTNNDVFGDVSGATPMAISFDDLRSVWGMTLGSNTIQLRITDSNSDTDTAATTVSLMIPEATPGFNFHVNAAAADDTSEFWNDLVPGNPSGLGLRIDKSPGNEVTRQLISNQSAELTHAFQFPGAKLNNAGGALLVASNTTTARSYLTPGWNTQPVSFEMWFKPDNLTPTPSNGQILFEDGGGIGLGLFLSSTGLQARKAGGGGLVTYNLATDPNNLLSGPATGEFIQAVFTYSTASGVLQLFVNGSLIDSATPGGNSWTGGDPAAFGTRGGANTGGIGGGQSNTESFQGQIALIRGYRNRILTAAEVEQNYLATIAPDTTPPEIAAFDPATGATGVYPGVGQIVATFNETIALTGEGTVTIKNLADGSGSSDIVISLPDASVLADGPELGITLASNLGFGTQYAIQISETAVTDESGNPFAGIDDSSTWTFTTAAENLIPPVILTQSPVHEAAGVWVLTSIVATFDQPLILGTGNVVIKDLLDDSSTKTIDVTDESQVSVMDNQLVINFASPLENERSYAVLIPSTAVRNFSDVNFAGITEEMQWNFTTSDLVPRVILISDLTPPGAPIENFFTDNFDNVAEIRHGNFADFTAPATQDALNGTGVYAGRGPADVVVIGRSLDSPPYIGEASEGYNALTIPVVNFTSYTARETGNRLGWHASDTTNNKPIAGDETTVTAAGAAILGLPTGNYNLHERVPTGNFNGLSDGTIAFGGGQILATIGGDTLAAYWETGAAPGSSFEFAGVETFPAPRLLFNLDNTPNVGNNGANDFNTLTATGLGALTSAIEFATPLVSLPAIIGLDPVEPEVVYPGSILVATFNKDIALTGSGSITIEDTMGSNDVTLDLTDPAQVTVSGRELIITPPANLAFGTSFEVVIAENTIQDLTSPPYVFGGTAPGQWTFTTAEEELTAPIIVAKSPEDGATRVALAAPIVATFDQNLLLNSAAATVLFEEGFEDDNGNFSGTGDWEWGAPNTDNGFDLVLNIGNGGSANAWATHLGDGSSPSGIITTGADSILQGPTSGIDLTGVALAQLEFAAAMDFAAGDIVEVRVRETGTDALLATLMPFGASPLEAIQTVGWTRYGPFDISAAAGHNVYLEFRYQGNTADFAGLYIDDLRVTGLDAAGVMTLRNLTDGFDTLIPINDASQVAVANNTLTITPAAPLKANSDYAVLIGAGVLRNFSDIGFAGISDDTTWNFTTLPIIAGVTVESFSSQLVGGFNRRADFVLDGSGFETNGPGTHATLPDDTMWLSNGTFGTTPSTDVIGPFPNSYIEFNLGANHDLALLTVWNYNEATSGLSTRGANNVTISVASSVGGTFTSLGDFVFNQAPGNASVDFGQAIDLSGLGANNVRLIRFDITSNHGGDNNFVGLSEVRFEGVVSSEPGGDSFADWIAGFPGLTNADPEFDFDGGGLATALEWVLGGDPTDPSDDAAIAPTFDNSSDPDFFIFTYRRTDAANTDASTAIAVEYGSNLSGWTTALAGPDIVITPAIDGAGPDIDLVEVKIRRSLVDDNLFARLSVTITEP